MQRSDLLLLVGTFVFGFATGIYVYFVLYEPNFRFSFTSSSTPDASYSIVGDEYGVCQATSAGCGSFRILSNREYRAIFTDTDGSIIRSREGLLPSGLLDEFHQELNRRYQRDTLRLYPTTRPACQQDSGGVLYTLDIPDVGRYYLDGCSRQVPTDDVLYRSLERMADYLEI